MWSPSPTRMRVATLFDTDEMYDSCERTVSRKWPSWYVIPAARHKPAATPRGTRRNTHFRGQSVARVRARILASRYGGTASLFTAARNLALMSGISLILVPLVPTFLFH